MSLVHFRSEYLSGIWAPTGLRVEMSLSDLTYFSCLQIKLRSGDTWVLVSAKLSVK